MRGLIVSALKGDSRSIGMLFRLAEQSGEFEDHSSVASIQRIIVDWGGGSPSGAATQPTAFPGQRDINRG
jgi:hypothetical protein